MTETSGCFTDKRSGSLPPHTSNTNSPSGGVDVSRSMSSVFRSGDYNLPSHTSHGHFITTQKQDYQQKETLPPAGVSTATKKAYSHVLPRSACYMHVAVLYFLPPSLLPTRRTAQGPALSALRQLLVDEHSRVFQNPRDPVSTNITRAFLNYDKDRLLRKASMHTCMLRRFAL